MQTRTLTFALTLGLCATFSCSSDPETDDSIDGSGGAVISSTGGTSVGTGGTNAGTGGPGTAAGAANTGVGGSAAGAGGSASGAGDSATAAGGSASGAGGSSNGAGGSADGTGGSANGAGGSTDGAGGSTDGAGGSAVIDSGVAYYAKQCAECHGDNGEGLDGKGPDIMHPVEDYSAFVIRNGRGRADDTYGVYEDLYEDDMDAYDETDLTPAFLEEIFTFLAEQPQPTTGEGLYRDYCAACHGNDGLGGLSDRSLMGEVDKVDELVRDGHAGDFDERHEFMPKWSDSELTDAELDLITDHVKTLVE